MLRVLLACSEGEKAVDPSGGISGQGSLASNFPPARLQLLAMSVVAVVVHSGRSSCRRSGCKFGRWTQPPGDQQRCWFYLRKGLGDSERWQFEPY